MSGPAFIDPLWRDVKTGARELARQPLFTAAAVVSLALAIGANTAIFTLVDQIVVRLLPVHDPRSLVRLKLGGYGRARRAAMACTRFPTRSIWHSGTATPSSPG